MNANPSVGRLLLVLLASGAGVFLPAQTTLLNDPLTSPPVGTWSDAVPAGAPAAGGGQTTFTAGGLRYSVSSATATDAGYRTLTSTAAPSTWNWIAQVDVHLDAFSPVTLTNGQWVNLNLHVVHVNSSGSPVASDHNSTIALDRYTSGGSVTRGVEVYLPGGGSVLHSASTAATVATLRMTYDAGAKTLSYFYDSDGTANGASFTQVGGATSLASWSVAASDNFAFLLIGGSGNDLAGVGPTLDGAGSYFTDFSLVAVPEPGTSALAAGLAGLLFAAWRRRCARAT